MRLWSLHPKYLDTKGLIALWRESLLAKHILQGRTRGYRHHPQLLRFKTSRQPLPFLHSYLGGIYDEANRRGYQFDRTKFRRQRKSQRMPVTRGQVSFEMAHLLRKLRKRDRRMYASLKRVRNVQVHPVFSIVSGSLEPWERGFG